MKWCAHCQQHKPLDEFYRSKKSADGHQWRCKPCTKSSVMVSYYANHEEHKARARERMLKRSMDPANREAKRERDRADYKRNPTPYKESAMRRRAREAAAPIRHFTDRDWSRIMDRQRGCCFYCGERKPLTKDHVIPLARGGSHSVGNIVGACATCNHRKRTKYRVEYLAWLRKVAA